MQKSLEANKVFNRKFASTIAEECLAAINRGDEDGFWEVLNPVLNSKVPFPVLDEIGRLLGKAGKHDLAHFFGVFDKIITTDQMAGYVIVGQGLSAFVESDLEASINKGKDAIMKGKKWYVCDIIGERVFGQALVDCFDRALPILNHMITSSDMHVRRSIGVAVHFFAKKRPKDTERLKQLLTLLSPLIEDRRTTVVKGVGWGLKTIGKYQPKLIEAYLGRELENKRPSKLLLRKATTYLRENSKIRFFEYWASNK